MGALDTDRQSRVDDVREEASNLRSMLEVHGENRIKQWFLLRGDRWKVAVALMVSVLVALLLLTRVQSIELRQLLTDTNTIQTLFNTLLSGIILLVSIVVSINSVFLSQEITDIESQQQRVDATVNYRNRIEEFIDSDVSPARPAEFLRVVLGTINRQAEVLADRAADSDEEAFADEATDFYDRVTEDTKNAGETLEDAKFGTFNVLLAGLNYDYSWQLHVARRFKRKYRDALTDGENEAIDDLTDTLKFFAVGREYFKSLYYKRELARLSSRLLYVALPTLVFTSYVLLALDSKLFPDVSMFGISPLVVFVSIAYTLALGPYLIFTAYVIRAATVTQRTLSAGPFVLQRGTDVGGLDWDGTVESIDWDGPSEQSERGESAAESASKKGEDGPTPDAEVHADRESEADD
ncbi:hypothetical protein [Halorussus halophilus]|uniref:hypothetical protein n=1 Tax=Halorussus halophilus TaxID=2650975 RepID=UPI0013014B79|nr:hypothetical protein [Halorussus halophilus]